MYLIMRTSNTASLEDLLEVLARRLERQDILLVLEGERKNSCGAIVVRSDVRLLYLKRYSKELNKKENLWDEISEKIFKNFALK